MDRGMASLLLTEKLDKSNYASWSYKMCQYLLGHGYWSYVDRANDAMPDTTHRDPSAWEQAASRVMYCFASSVNDQLLNHIRDAKTSTEACGKILKKFFVTSTTARKLRLMQELNSIRQRDMLVTDYTTEVKEIYDTLWSINGTVDEDEMVQICLGGPAKRYGSILTVICTREKPASFFDLQSMLMVEKKHASGSWTTQSDNWMLYTKAKQPHGRGG